jgi:arginase family enzyme
MSLGPAIRSARRSSKPSYPEHDGPTAFVPVEMEQRDGIEAKTVVLQQLRAALAIIGQHDPARITTLGGECSVSIAPFSYLIDKYGDDLAILTHTRTWAPERPTTPVATPWSSPR